MWMAPTRCVSQQLLLMLCQEASNTHLQHAVLLRQLGILMTSQEL